VQRRVHDQPDYTINPMFSMTPATFDFLVSNLAGSTEHHLRVDHTAP